MIFLFISFFFVDWSDEKYYNTASESMKCKDGSKKINRSQLNDDFCDCADGSDEPGKIIFICVFSCPNIVVEFFELWHLS